MKKKVLAIAALVVMMAGLIGVIQPQSVSADHRPNHDPEPKVTICHRDNNILQPYGPKAIEVNLSAVDGDGNSDHFGQHTGPLASSLAYATYLKFVEGTKWGDIIPPTEAHPEGLNWTAIGEAMWKNDCQYVTSATPEEVIFVDPTCDTLGSYTIPKTKGVKYLIDGEVVAKGEYSVQNGETITVTAKAKKGYYLTGQTEWSHTFYAPEDCEEEVADIKYGVVCSAEGAVVTFTNTGDTEGDVTLNGEVITVAAGATVERTFDTTDAGLQITIVIGEETVYDQLVICDTGDVLGDTDTPVVLPNTSGSIAPIIAAIAAFSLIAGAASLAIRSALIRQ